MPKIKGMVKYPYYRNSGKYKFKGLKNKRTSFWREEREKAKREARRRAMRNS